MKEIFYSKLNESHFQINSLSFSDDTKLEKFCILPSLLLNTLAIKRKNTKTTLKSNYNNV